MERSGLKGENKRVVLKDSILGCPRTIMDSYIIPARQLEVWIQQRPLRKDLPGSPYLELTLKLNSSPFYGIIFRKACSPLEKYFLSEIPRPS